MTRKLGWDPYRRLLHGLRSRLFADSLAGRAAWEKSRGLVSQMLVALPLEHRSNFWRLMLLSTLIRAHLPDGIDDMRRSYGHCLVRFYAVESGLKYLLSVKEKIPHAIEIRGTRAVASETVESYGHDLNAMAKRLRIPAKYGSNLAKTFNLSGGHKSNGRPQQFPIARAHEAWRYGLVVRATDQGALDASLAGLIEWIKAVG